MLFFFFEGSRDNFYLYLFLAIFWAFIAELTYYTIIKFLNCGKIQ